MAVVILYYYGVARVRGAFIESAFTGCALLVGLTTPIFLLASWLAERRRARRRARATPGRRPGPPIPGAASSLAATRWIMTHRCRCEQHLSHDHEGAWWLGVGAMGWRGRGRTGQAAGVAARKPVTAAVNSAGRSRCGECPQPGSTCSVYRPPAAW